MNGGVSKTNVTTLNTVTQNHPQHITHMHGGVSKEIIFILVFKYT